MYRFIKKIAQGISEGTLTAIPRGTSGEISSRTLGEKPECLPEGSSVRIQAGIIEKTLGEIPGGILSEIPRRTTRETLLKPPDANPESTPRLYEINGQHLRHCGFI